MATLLLTHDEWVTANEPEQDLPTLRTWLREGWAILFSHPDDFFVPDMESDRLLTVIDKTYANRGVRPMAVTHDPLALHRGWVAHVSGHALVTLEGRMAGNADIIDLRTHTLGEHLASLQRRFVVLVDSLLRRRKTLVYERSLNMPSPLDFLAYVDMAREAAGSTALATRDFALSLDPSEGRRAYGKENRPLQSNRGRRQFNDFAYLRH